MANARVFGRVVECGRVVTATVCNPLLEDLVVVAGRRRGCCPAPGGGVHSRILPSTAMPGPRQQSHFQPSVHEDHQKAAGPRGCRWVTSSASALSCAHVKVQCCGELPETGRGRNGSVAYAIEDCWLVEREEGLTRVWLEGVSRLRRTLRAIRPTTSGFESVSCRASSVAPNGVASIFKPRGVW